MPVDEKTTDDLSNDPLSDGFEDSSSDVVVGDGTTPESTDPIAEQVEPPNPLEGLPFKDASELASAYKKLTNDYAKGRLDYYEVRKQLSEIVPLLKKEVSPSSNEPTEADVVNAIGEFFKNPNAALEKLIKPLKDDVASYKREAEMARKERDLNKFLSENKDLTDEDEVKLVEIINSNPRIKALGTTYEQLDAAMDRMIRLEPTRFSKRTPIAPNADLLAAKKGATSLGNKPGGKGANAPQDEFDAILADDASSRSRWK